MYARFIIFLTFLLSVIGCSFSAFGQITSSQSIPATAYIAVRLSVSWSNTTLDFGTLSPGAAGGSVTINFDGTKVSYGTWVKTQTASAVANFTVSGEPGYTFIVSSQPVINLSQGAGNTMTFTPAPSVNGGTIGAGGSTTVQVAGTLTFAGAVPAGVYQGNFTITVDYN